MAKGANGTIDLASFEQMNQQRIAIEAQNTRNRVTSTLGVGSNNTETLFSGSPLLLTNRTNMDRDPNGLYTDVQGDVYKAYANVVDPSNKIVGGFGFKNTEEFDLNYRHTNNPFIVPVEGEEEGVNNTDPTSLTTGIASAKTGNKKHYLGFPDLLPPSINAPTDNTLPAASGLSKSRNSNFGSTTSADRQKLNEVYPDSADATPDTRGTFDYDNFSDVEDGADNLGKYFRRKYTS